MIRINVEINNKSWQKKIKNPKKYFNKKLKKISKIVSFFKGKKTTFTILLTNSSKMKKLNKKFRNRNKPTDVLSFPFLSKNDFGCMSNFWKSSFPHQGYHFLQGTEVISLRVKRERRGGGIVACLSIIFLIFNIFNYIIGIVF